MHNWALNQHSAGKKQLCLSLFSLSLTLALSLLLKTIIKHIYAPPQLCRGWVGVARDAFKPHVRLSVCVYHFGRIWTFSLGEKDLSELETSVLLEHGWCCHYSTAVLINSGNGDVMHIFWKKFNLWKDSLKYFGIILIILIIQVKIIVMWTNEHAVLKIKKNKTWN